MCSASVGNGLVVIITFDPTITFSGDLLRDAYLRRVELQLPKANFEGDNDEVEPC